MGKHIEMQELEKLMNSYGFKTITEMWDYISSLEKSKKEYEHLKAQIISVKKTINFLCK